MVNMAYRAHLSYDSPTSHALCRVLFWYTRKRSSLKSEVSTQCFHSWGIHTVLRRRGACRYLNKTYFAEGNTVQQTSTSPATVRETPIQYNDHRPWAETIPCAYAMSSKGMWATMLPNPTAFKITSTWGFRGAVYKASAAIRRLTHLAVGNTGDPHVHLALIAIRKS